MFGFGISKSFLFTPILDSVRNSVAATSVLTANSVRYRYFEDRPKILKRNHGYKDKLEWRGPLPHVKSIRALPIKAYVPSKNWCEKKALFGQNDYIDILGDNEKLHPIKFQHIPGWLKGFSGNEYQMLLRKRAFFGHQIAKAAPNDWLKLKKRIKYLYRFLNYNTKNFMDKKVLRR